jgi:hypothetical protein
MGSNRIDVNCIRRTEAEFNRLSQAVHAAHAQRHTSKAALVAWRAAATTFHAYASPVFELWSDEARQGILQGGDWREAALCYLELHPRFFRSGYLRDYLCHLLKQCVLSASERSRVLTALVFVLEACPMVGRFRYDCRLATRWADDAFVARLYVLANRKDAWVYGRSRRMLDCIVRHGGSRFCV